MNEPLDSPSQEQESADQIEWSEAARLAFFIVGGAAVVWLAFGPSSNEPRWLWLSHVVVFLAYCLFLIRGFWIAWVAKRNGTSEKQVSTLQMLLFTVVILILWNLMPFLTAEFYEFLGFDVATHSAGIEDFGQLLAIFAACLLFDVVVRRWTGKRLRADTEL